ncbi:hypothetical protein MKX01_014641 [Papaver californicum]|nr:hypothetical protein MKX01_014641 [Papaver californicum]
MCNELEEGKKLPPLLSLGAIDPDDVSMEVVLVDRQGDSRLQELEDKAQELHFATGNSLLLVEKLGKLVSIYMGDYKRCIVLPIGSLSVGLCRHRAILFKKLAEYIGLPCRIAQGCKYCAADHQSFCLVKIEDICTPGDQETVSEAPAAVLHVPVHAGHDIILEPKNEVVVARSSVIVPKLLNLEPSLALDWVEIPWDELQMKERVGAGTVFVSYYVYYAACNDVLSGFGRRNETFFYVNFSVSQVHLGLHRAEWHGSVAIMKRVRHPNDVLFMGAVTKRPHLSIVTEYLPRGSLFRLIHSASGGELWHKRRRLRIALDVAKGINYLHCLSPPIVHWDLKSPNLLVDKNWTVKVYDFGLSRFTANTFLIFEVGGWHSGVDGPRISPWRTIKREI